VAKVKRFRHPLMLLGKNQWVEVTKQVYGVKPFFFFNQKQFGICNRLKMYDNYKV
jgi:hypothetical protein